MLYECEEERVVVKACLRELVKLRKTSKHTSWDTAEAANMALDWMVYLAKSSFIHYLNSI